MADNNVKKMPFNDTPIWEYLNGYFKAFKQGPAQAEYYLETEVPEQLQEQIDTTLRKILLNERI